MRLRDVAVLVVLTVVGSLMVERSRPEPTFAEALGVGMAPATVVVFQLADCPELRGGLSAIARSGPVVGRLVGAGEVSDVDIDAALRASGITFPVSRVPDRGVEKMLRRLGHPATPRVLRLGQNGALLSISADFIG